MPLSTEAKLAIGVGAAAVVLLGGLGLAYAGGRPEAQPLPPPQPPVPPPRPTTTTAPANTLPPVPPPQTPVTPTPVQTPGVTTAPWDGRPPRGWSYTPPEEEEYQRGTTVWCAQKILKLLGYPIDQVDGVNGENTQAAVRLFQRAEGLTADGKIGTQTMYRIGRAAEEFAEKNPQIEMPRCT